MELFRLIVTGAFVLLAALGFRLWRHHRSPATVWLTWMFVSLGGARLTSHLLPDQNRSGMLAVLGVAVTAALVSFPYFLFRFGESFRPVDRRWRRTVALMAALTVVATVVVFSGNAGTDTEPPSYGVFVFAVIAEWTVLTGWVVWRLWSAGRSQATLTRRRMWTMAAAAGLLNAALLLAGTGDSPVTGTVGEAVALVAALTFMLAFVPPRFIRELWRRIDERAFWLVERDLVAADTRDAVVAAVLPHVARLVGGGGAMFVDASGSEAVAGLAGASLDRVRQDLAAADGDRGVSSLDAGVATVILEQGRLGVATSEYAPLFGQDELELLERLGSLLDLALSRAQLFDRERAARISADEARARAEEASAELEALLYGISHDLRTPIVSVRGYVECLAEDYGAVLDDEGRHFLERLRSNTEYMDQLVGDLLKLSRLGSIRDEPDDVDLMEVATHVADEIRSVHPDVRIEIGELPHVRMGAARARQMLTNLMINAVVHSGRPDVAIHVGSVQSDADAQAVIRVADNGCGIPAPARERVFDLFETVPQPGDNGQAHGGKQSSGIGLAITSRIVREAGGRIWIHDSDSDSGADVRVQLPRSAPGRVTH